MYPFAIIKRLLLSFGVIVICCLFLNRCTNRGNGIDEQVIPKDRQLLVELDSLFKIRKFNLAKNKALNYLADTSLPHSPLIDGEAMIKLYQALTYEEKKDSSDLIFQEILSYTSHQLTHKLEEKIKGKAYLSQAKILQDDGLFDSSKVILVLARDYLQNNLPEETAYSYILSAKAAYFHYKNDEAISYLDLARDLSKVNKLPNNTLYLIDNWYSLVLEDLGEYEQAISHSEKILQRLNKQNHSNLSKEEITSLLHTYQNLGMIYNWKGDIEKGQKHFFRALNIIQYHESPDSAEIAILLNNVGIGSLNKLDFDQALTYFKQSNSLLLANNLDRDQKKTKIESNQHIAFCFNETHQYDSALMYARRGFNFQKGESYVLDYTYHNLASAYLGKKLYSQALDTAILSIQEATKRYGDRHRLVARAHRLLGKIFIEMGYSQKALDAFQESLIASSKVFSAKDFKKNPELKLVYDKKSLLDNLTFKGRVLFGLIEKSPDDNSLLIASRDTYKSAIEVIEYLRNDYSDDVSKYQLLNKATPIYDMALQTATLLDQGKQDQKLLAQAFNISEQGKSMILQDNMRSAFALQSPEIPDVLKRQEDSLRINIAFYGQRVSMFENKAKLNSYDSTQYKNAQRIFLNSEEAYSNLLKSFEEKFPDYVARKKRQESASIKEIFTYLDTAQLTLIEYFWGEKSLYAFLLHEGKIQMFELPKDQQLEAEMEAWRNSVSNSTEVFNQGNSQASLAAFKKAGHAIYQKILAPLLADVPEGSNLVIIPDGPLNLFPFDALIFDKQDSVSNYEELDYVLQHHQIQYALSASFLLKEYSSVQRTYDFLGYAPSYVEARSLDYNKQEVSEIASLIKGKAVIGASANKANFIEHANKARFLHLSQHAINEQDPLRSHLLFSPLNSGQKNQTASNPFSAQTDPQKLHAFEIYNQKLPCELAVLNACETGEGMLIQGEGMLSLSRAFRHAGAESVIMNKWRVNDEASFRILSGFYELLTKGHNTAGALRQSKINYLKNTHKTHPYFWAGSALIGNAKRPVFTSQVNDGNTGLDYGLFVGLWALGILFLLGIILKLSGMVYPKHPDTFK